MRQISKEEQATLRQQRELGDAQWEKIEKLLKNCVFQKFTNLTIGGIPFAFRSFSGLQLCLSSDFMGRGHFRVYLKNGSSATKDLGINVVRGFIKPANGGNFTDECEIHPLRAALFVALIPAIEDISVLMSHRETQMSKELGKAKEKLTTGNISK